MALACPCGNSRPGKTAVTATAVSASRWRRLRSAILTLRRWRQAGQELRGSLSYLEFEASLGNRRSRRVGERKGRKRKKKAVA